MYIGLSCFSNLNTILSNVGSVVLLVFNLLTDQECLFFIRTTRKITLAFQESDTAQMPAVKIFLLEIRLFPVL